MNIFKKIYFFRKNALKPDFMNLSKIGKPYSIHLEIFVLRVLEYNLSKKNIFNPFLTPEKMTGRFSQTTHLKQNNEYK